ncbi:MAG: S24 family peptidase [Betaproteobacteria bacterium]
MDRMARTIPIRAVAADDCAAAEPFALMVLGDAMAPEFRDGDVIVVEPEGHATDGAYVVAFVEGEWLFRRLAARGSAWQLVAEDARHPAIDLPGLDAVRGVVIQRSTPGRRSRNKRYG